MSTGLTISTDKLIPNSICQPVRCDWLPDVAAQFQAMAKLPADWNSHGAAVPDNRILEAALANLTTLCALREIPRPHANPTPNGGVQFESEQGTTYFEIEFLSPSEVAYLFRDDSRRLEEEAIVGTGELPQLVARYIS